MKKELRALLAVVAKMDFSYGRVQEDSVMEELHRAVAEAKGKGKLGDPVLRWRPIKTAPKDRLILLAQPPHSDEYSWVVMQGRWIELLHSNELHTALRAGGPIPESSAGRWLGCYHGIMNSHGERVDGIQTYEERPLCLYPSHWMALPGHPRGKHKQPHL